MTFGSRTENIAGLLCLAGGVASAIGAGAYASQLGLSSLSGLTGAIAGTVTGTAVGGAVGYGLGKLSEAVWPSDNAGRGMTEFWATAGGAAVGAISGGIGGALGGQPLLVVPAVLAAGTLSSLALGSAAGMVLRD